MPANHSITNVLSPNCTLNFKHYFISLFMVKGRNLTQSYGVKVKPYTNGTFIKKTSTNTSPHSITQQLWADLGQSVGVTIAT